LFSGPLLKPLFFLIGMYGIYNLAAGNRRGMLAISIIGQAVAIGLFVVFKVSYPVAISYVLLGGYAAAGLIGVVFAPRNTQGRTLEEIQGSDTSRPAAARV